MPSGFTFSPCLRLSSLSHAHCVLCLTLLNTAIFVLCTAASAVWIISVHKMKINSKVISLPLMLFKESLHKIAVSRIYTTHFISKGWNHAIYIKELSIFQGLIIQFVLLAYLSCLFFFSILLVKISGIKSGFQLFNDIDKTGVLLGGDSITLNEVAQYFLQVHKHIFPDDYHQDSSYQIHWLPFISSPLDLLPQLCFLETLSQVSKKTFLGYMLLT